MMKYCARNLNAAYRINFKYSRDKKTYSLSTKIGLPGKRTFRSSLCVNDFTASMANPSQ